MPLALIHPPTCDPTAPYVAIPTLTAYLRQHGHEVLPVDANVDAFTHLLRPEQLAPLADQVWERFRRLDRQPALDHVKQLAYLRLHDAAELTRVTVEGIADALAVLRDPARFYDHASYDRAVTTVEDALELIGAAYHPLRLSFESYRSPFALLTEPIRRRDAQADRNPFHGYVQEQLLPRLATDQIDAVGLSVVFPGQLQPAYSLAYQLRAARPELLLLAGGPGFTQLFLRLTPAEQAQALVPFDAVVLGEGEVALRRLLEQWAAGRRPTGVVLGERTPDLAELPPPDFAGLDLTAYLSPEPVLPFDATRGCYWGRCAFCHYGLTDRGTAPYRPRPPARVAAALRELAARHGCRLFYLSQDTIAPRTLQALARELTAQQPGTPLRWATDCRPERRLTESLCQELRAGGGLALSFGIESAAPRVLQLIDKGITPAEATRAVHAAARAGLAVEAMCFTGFPTETPAEALQTLDWLDRQQGELALFICGEFQLTVGSRVATDPARFGLGPLWHVAGDELQTALFHEPSSSRPPDPAAQARVERRLQEVQQRWLLRSYPWAGSLSTAHTLLWYAHHGPQVFRQLADRPHRDPGLRRRGAEPRYDLDRLGQTTTRAEAKIWEELIQRRRRVDEASYAALAASQPAIAAAAPRRRSTGRRHHR